LFAQKRIKKGSHSLDQSMADFPVLLTKTADSENRTPYGILRRVVYLFFAVLLGCVK
jgi:hypothetical protein